MNVPKLCNLSSGLTLINNINGWCYLKRALLFEWVLLVKHCPFQRATIQENKFGTKFGLSLGFDEHPVWTIPKVFALPELIVPSQNPHHFRCTNVLNVELQFVMCAHVESKTMLPCCYCEE